MARLKEHKYNKRCEYYTEQEYLDKARGVMGAKDLCALHGDIDRFVATTGKRFDLSGINHIEALRYVDPIVMTCNDTKHSIYELKRSIDRGDITDSATINNKLDTMIDMLNIVIDNSKKEIKSYVCDDI